MKNMHRSKSFARFFLCAVLFGSYALLAQDVNAQNKKPKVAKKAKGGKDAGSDANTEYDAQALLKKGIEYLDLKQEERGIKTITQVTLQYPDSNAAFKAEVVLGNYYIEKKQYDLAIKRLQKVAQNEDPDIQAEALYKIGICYFNSGEYNHAFTSLRQVVNKYPGSIYANEAYYYIGLCHFSLNRWTQAVDALERVGTSVEAQNKKDEAEGKKPAAQLNLAEAGQRLFVKIYDEDLVVLFTEDSGKKLKVRLTDTNGDEETIEMQSLGREGAMFIGSIPTQPGVAKKEDGILQTKGGDTVTVMYVDTHTASGKTNQEIKALIPLVSTATVGFTNGDYQDYSYGIFGGQDFFMRVRDLDRDESDQPDTVTVKVTSSYKVEKEDDLTAGINFDEQQVEYEVRDTKEYTLKETGPRTGVFTAVAKSVLVDPAAAKKNTAEAEQEGKAAAPATENGNGRLKVANGDLLQIEYVDDMHILGQDPIARIFKARVVVGEVPNVQSQSREVNDLVVKARKNLIEGQILLHLAQIFKDVGLIEYASNKAVEGISKIDEVLKINTEAPLEHAILEDAFNTKWELYIVQDKIKEAISVCSMLIKMFPESSLVDRALMKIAEIKIKEGGSRPVAEGLNIYRGILQLPKSDLKPEAQYRIAEVMMEEAIQTTKDKQAKDPTYKPNYGPVMQEFKKCADNYPDSSFAGKALEKIADFYLNGEDYQRVLDMMEQLFRDYPDADFLDKMLYKWASAAFKLERFELANEKCEQLMSEYPNSAESKKAALLRKLISDRVSQLNSEE